MKKLLCSLSICVFAITFIACSDDDSSNTGEKEQYLSSIDVTYNGQTEAISFKYTDSWSISEISVSFCTLKFSYNEQKQLIEVEETYREGASNYYTETYVFSYEGNKVTEILYSSLGNSYNDTVVYTVNSAGLPISAYESILGMHLGGGSEPIFIEKIGDINTVFTYNANQQATISEQSSVSYDGTTNWTNKITYEYDDKLHPLANIDFQNIWIYTHDLLNSSTDLSILGFGFLKNNCTKDIKYNKNNNTNQEELVNSRQYSYEYNDKGLPISMAATIDIEQSGPKIFSCVFNYKDK